MRFDVSDVKTLRWSVFTIGVTQSKEYEAGGYAARLGRLCDGDRKTRKRLAATHRLSPEIEIREALPDGERLRVFVAPRQKLGEFDIERISVTKGAHRLAACAPFVAGW